MKKINEVSKSSGVTVRTLHYYDEIGLLKPSRLTEKGYRLYSQDDLVILEQILLYRELGFELKSIKKLINSSKKFKNDALKKQRELLNIKKDRLNNLINLIDRRLDGDRIMNFSDFDNSEFIKKQKEYEREVESRWGEAREYKEYRRAGKKKSRGEEERLIFNKIANNIDLPFESETIQALIKEWQDCITNNYYECSNDMLLNLGEMYLEDERFKKYFETIKEGLTEYIVKAISFYCK